MAIYSVNFSELNHNIESSALDMKFSMSKNIDGLDSNGRVPIGGVVCHQESSLTDSPVDERILIAKKKGYKSTSNPNIFYKEVKEKPFDSYAQEPRVYYIWDSNKNKFKKNIYIKTIDENGNYIMARKESPYGEVHYNAKGEEIKSYTSLQLTAMKEGLELTPNASFFYDKENDVYYKWQSSYSYKKQGFKPQNDIKAVYDNGAFKTVNKNGVVKYWDKYSIYELSEYEAKGYEPIKDLGLYFDKKNKIYYAMDKDTKSLVKTDITAIYDYTERSREQILCKKIIKEGDKYYFILWDGSKEPAIKNDLYAVSNGYRITQETGLYFKDGKNYRYNDEKKIFEEYGTEIEINKTIAEKADGKIDNSFQYGVGDCWLISVIQGFARNQKGLEIIEKSLSVDENGSIIVHLKGPNKKYTFTNEELNNALKSKNYSYGDKDVLAIELAVEKYYLEQHSAGNFSNTRENANYFSFTRGLIADFSKPEKPMLDGGISSDAIHILTGCESKMIEKIDKEAGVYIVNTDTPIKGDFESEALKVINNKNNIVFASIKTNDSYDPYHGINISRVDDKFVYYYDTTAEHDNPLILDTQETPIKEQKIPIREFFDEKICSFTYTDLSTTLSQSKLKKFVPKSKRINCLVNFN